MTSLKQQKSSHKNVLCAHLIISFHVFLNCFYGTVIKHDAFIMRFILIFIESVTSELEDYPIHSAMVCCYDGLGEPLLSSLCLHKVLPAGLIAGSLTSVCDSLFGMLEGSWLCAHSIRL